MKTGIELIAAERQRQIEKEGFDAAHDDNYINDALPKAAIAYTLPLNLRPAWLASFWPWSRSWWKPGDRVKELAKAGALIADSFTGTENFV